MDWKIQRRVVRYAFSEDDHEIGGTVSGTNILVRSDNKSPLGLVSSKYKVVQPTEVLEFFRDLTNANGYTLHTAGTLFGGKRFWALASIGEEACVVGEDKIGGYLLLSTSCDGTLATSARFTTVRVVCNNTLSMALSGQTRREYTVRHTSKFNADLAKQELGLARDHFGEFLKASRALAAKSISNDTASQFVGGLLKSTGMVTADDVRESVPYKKILDLFKSSAMGGTLLGAEGSAWGLVNAVTEYVDHHAKATTTSNRLASAWFGRGDNLKSQALKLAGVI
jgi:phage/plasmid-like protein (TIGR03299 family)